MLESEASIRITMLCRSKLQSHTFPSKGVPYAILAGRLFPMLVRVDKGQEDGMTYFNLLQRSPLG